MMDANPILAETLRGNWVENRHRGAYVVTDADGSIIAAAGDIERPVFPRSSIKSIQALAIFARQADSQFALTDAELALACASHTAQEVHVEVASGLLSRLGLSAADLECGAHQPIDAAARAALRAQGLKPSSLHNACSGKHSGMLSVALAMGVPTAGYGSREHAVQQQVRACIEAVIGETLTETKCGTDGCSIPTYAAPLHSFARGFARMATGQGLSPETAASAKRLFDAATGHPQLVAGTGHPDTLIMTAFKGRVMQKYGADGVQCGAIRDKGWGYALKCDDGSLPASLAMLAGLLLQIAAPDPEQRTLLEGFAHQPIKSVRGAVVGEMRAVWR
ncbi:MAG: asparaginase [Devosia sp.]